MDDEDVFDDSEYLEERSNRVEDEEDEDTGAMSDSSMAEQDKEMVSASKVFTLFIRTNVN